MTLGRLIFKSAALFVSRRDDVGDIEPVRANAKGPEEFAGMGALLLFCFFDSVLYSKFKQF